MTQIKRIVLFSFLYAVLALTLIFSKSISTFVIDSCNNSFDVLCNNTVAMPNPFGF